MDASVDVVIVGGGIAGLVLALELDRAGIGVAVLEQQPKISPLPRAELLQPNALKILDRHGVVESLCAAGARPIPAFRFLDESGQRLCTIDYGPLPPPHNLPLNAQPHVLHALLEDRVKRRPGIRLTWGASVLGVVRSGGRIAGVSATIEGLPTRIGCRILVGADGAFSAVRDALSIPSEVHLYRHGYFTMVIDLPPEFGLEGRYYLGPERILGLFPLDGRRLYAFTLFRWNDREQIVARGIENLKREMGRIDPSIEGPLAELTSWSQVGFRPAIRVRAAHWVVDGAALMGDAAHAMNPHVAQGRNQGLEDAVTLAETLTRAFSMDNLSASALRTYEHRRRPWVEALQKEGDILTLLWNSGNPLIVRMRNRIFRTVDRDPALKKKILSQVAGISPRGFNLVDRLVALGLAADLRNRA